MKIHYIKTDEKVICGMQVVMNDGRELEFTTNFENCGLWLNGKQVIGNCDFSLNCSSSKDVWHDIKFNSAIGIPEYMALSSKEWDKLWNDWRAKFQPIDKNNVELPMFDFGF